VKDYQLDADAALFRPSHPSTKSYALQKVSRDEHRRGRLGRLSFNLTDKLADPACPVHDAHP
jgi:hypothetical protein